MYINNLSKRYGGKVIFEKLCYRFPEKAAIALAGVNGAGKTTLLNILCNLEEADDGNVIKNKGQVIGYLPQEPNQNPKSTVFEEALDGAAEIIAQQKRLEEVLSELAVKETKELYQEYDTLMHDLTHNNGFGIESEAKELLIGLGFSHSQLEQDPKTLSGGWRMRLELVRLFLKRPNFLILDEPTNHLDLPSMQWVEGFLKKFDGCLLFVTHDRSLINRLATGILHLNQGKLKYYVGNYDKFLETYALEQELLVAQKQNIESKAQHMEKFVEKFGAKASKARQAQSRLKLVEKLYQQSSSLEVDEKLSTMRLKLECAQKSGKVVLEIKNLTTGYSNEKILCKNLSFKVERGQKIAIVGANGIGKSTLLKTLQNIIKPISGEYEWGHNVDVAYFAQDQLNYLMPDLSVLENVMQINHHLSMAQARTILGSFLFKGDEVFKQLRVLSGGEKNRVGLCCLLAKKANTLMLDEPTNHLDMQSIDILADALSNFEGTLLLVSHNISLIDDVATHILGMNAKGHTLLVEGDWQRFEDKAKEVNFSLS